MARHRLHAAELVKLLQSALQRLYVLDERWRSSTSLVYGASPAGDATSRPFR